MGWNYGMVEIRLDDMFVQPTYGPGDLTRDQARAEIAGLLDRVAHDTPAAQQLVQAWQQGADTVFLGPFTWLIYEHHPGEPRAGMVAWLDDWISRMPADVQRLINRAQPRSR